MLKLCSRETRPVWDVRGFVALSASPRHQSKATNNTRSKKLLGAPGIATRSDRTLRTGLLAVLLGARPDLHRPPSTAGRRQGLPAARGALVDAGRLDRWRPEPPRQPRRPEKRRIGGPKGIA